MKVVWTEHALVCLTEIEDFIAQDDPIVAVQLIEKLIARTDMLQEHPHAGRRVPEVPKSGFRELVEANYRIVYRIHEGTIEVLTVFEAHRLYPGGD
ncbi:type II toxin-antitoxin system RelE/ParE family toxin [Desulfuromonas sp. CSMB_57]|uniref:type II toxin-antitoxin system RelE/ParE family toxin n=1 Tax=Desulfuromonas sp. CSMB_57 TaxID=2807629 RepID=UPI001CD40B5E|nr:type II toxin-antitoxin system RelE/ParE family toxin [Desulfuromonas sp. CSMB_57]